MSPASVALPRKPAVPRRRSPLRGRQGLVLAASLALLAAAGAAVLPERLRSHGAPAEVCATDAVQHRALAGLAGYAAWLRENHVAGFVGEVGWPGGPEAARWNALARTWYAAADRMKVPVTAWAAGPWPTSYGMAVYRFVPGHPRLDSAGPQAAVLARHTGELHGVSAADGSFGTSADDYDAAHPGAYGQTYGYPGDGDYAYLARRGVRLVRLSFAWERLQPEPLGPLAPAEVARLRDSVASAQNHGLHVLLDLHGYGDFKAAAGTTARLGSAALPAGALADLWARLVPALPPVYGLALLNEPSRLALKGPAAVRLWQDASQQAVDAIRRAGSSAVVVVGGYAQMGPGDWARLRVRPWINDPGNRVAYDAHAYFDADATGRYAASYDATLHGVQGGPDAAAARCFARSAFDPSSAADRTRP